MSKQAKTTSGTRRIPDPPPFSLLPVLHGGAEIGTWIDHYWSRLGIPGAERRWLAVTQDRQEFARWTGRRLNSLALGCYCYLPQPPGGRRIGRAPQAAQEAIGSSIELRPLAIHSTRARHTPAATPLPSHRHLMFIEPDLLPQSLEVTVAHELIHLSDRIQGTPRRHRCHGYDAIALDEAAITGYPVEELRALLREETSRREAALRRARPIRYIYICPSCGKEYPRTRRYSREVSCGTCDRAYNPTYRLLLKEATSYPWTPA
jgi:predicted SprT family Zn-dependent metalloprotease